MITRQRNIALLLSVATLLQPGLSAAQDTPRQMAQGSTTFQLSGDAFQPPAPATASMMPSGQTPAVTVAATGAPALDAPALDAVELAALYYYAEQKQEARVTAEAARLRLKYPGFELPKDLFTPVTARGADESTLWALFEKNDFTGIDADLVRRKTEMPDWTPTEDFSRKLTAKKQRVLMSEATAARNWTGVIEAASAIDPARETEVDLVWMLIDAYAETGMRKELSDAYRGLLTREGEARLPDAALVVTLQKALRDFPAAEVQAVMGKLVPPGDAVAFEPVQHDLARKRIADYVAQETTGLPLAEADLAPLTAAIAQKPTATDMTLLGWYYLKIRQPAVGAQWFSKALALAPEGESAKGLYLSLSAQNRTDEASAVVAAHLKDLSSDPEFLMNALSSRFSRPEGKPIEEPVVVAYSTTILEMLNADHAEVLAWYAYNAKQYEAAAAWFGKAIDWKEAAPRVKGLALSTLRLGDKDRFAALKTRYAGVYPQIWAEIDVAKPPKTETTATAVDKPRAAVEANYLKNFRAKRYGACVSDLADLKARGQLTSGAAMIGGWCYLSLGRAAEAKAFFAPGLQGSGAMRSDAAYGTALALLRAKMSNEAEAVLAAYPLTADREREIRAEVFVQRARAAFDAKNYKATLEALNSRASLAAEPADLSQLRGWAYYHLGDRRTANKVFQRLADHLSDPAIRRGLIVTSQVEDHR